MVHGMLYGNEWGAIACHSGDMGFDSLFLGDFPKTVTHLEKHGGFQGFLNYVKEVKKLKGLECDVLMMLFFCALDDHRDLHRVGRRQRQKCIRERIKVGQTGMGWATGGKGSSIPSP